MRFFPIERKSILLFLVETPIVLLFSACLNSPLEPEEDSSPVGTVFKLNKNVKGLSDLANACMNADSVAIFDISYNEDQSVLYWLSMKKGGDIELYSEIVSDVILVPELSMVQTDGVFYWTVNGVALLDSDGSRVAVMDLTKPVSFYLHDELILCRVENSIVGEYPVTKSGDYLKKDVTIEYDINDKAFNLCLSSGYTTTIPTVSVFHIIDESVPNRSFYKDVFLDAGIAMTSRKSLAAAKYLGLSLEGMSFPYSGADAKDKALQTAIISGDSHDLNGRLLYPDGQPRYRLLFVNGGSSTAHGLSLGEEGVENMRSFVLNGGSYIGTCAGAFLAANGYDSVPDYPYFLSVWPGIVQHTKLNHNRTGMFIERSSPLLQYYDFDGDLYVDSVRHNSGGYPKDFPVGTEVLARYDFPSRKNMHKQPSIWAYKRTPQSGRIIQCGSHPEEVPDGERRDLTAAMILYALDGVGTVSLKGFLKNGEERAMDKRTTDKDPAFTRIGDLQTHHFVAYVPSDAKNIRVEVSSSSKCDLALMMNQGTYAFSDVAEYKSSASGANQQLFFPSIREGLWFIAVQCLTTVTVTETDYGQEYGGNLEVLNGIPYRISISWE